MTTLVIASLFGSFIGGYAALFTFGLLLRTRKPKPSRPICAFCDASYPTKEQMQEHIRICPKHPLSQYTAKSEVSRG